MGGVAFAFAERTRKFIMSDDFTRFIGRKGTLEDVERGLAINIAHEAGHTYGLMHLDTAHSIMHYWSNNIVASEKEAWAPGPIVATDGIIRACKDPKGVNFVTPEDPRAVLLKILGPAKK